MFDRVHYTIAYLYIQMCICMYVYIYIYYVCVYFCILKVVFIISIVPCFCASMHTHTQAKLLWSCQSFETTHAQLARDWMQQVFRGY